MNTKEKILRQIEIKQSSTGKELSELLGISRQAVNKHLKELIQNRRVFKGEFKLQVHHLMLSRRLPGVTGSLGIFLVYD